jgi:hypothetical protein
MSRSNMEGTLGQWPTKKSSTPKALHPLGESTMPQSLPRIYLHIVFSTKERHPFLIDEAIRNEVHSFLDGECNSLEYPVTMRYEVYDLGRFEGKKFLES